VRKPDYFDIRQHFRDLHRYVLPIFVFVAAVLMVIFLIIRTGERSPLLEWDESSTARIGLLAPVSDPIFDPAFATLSPIEMTLAPTADHFEQPVGTRHGSFSYNAQPFFTSRHLGDDINGIGGWNSDLGDSVHAAADGVVVFAGWPSDGWGNIVILLHELANGELVETLYAHLESMSVPVGRRIRRGDRIGTIGTAGGTYLAHLHFELRRTPTLDAGAGYSDAKLGRLSGELALRKWRQRRDDQLVAAPTGVPLEPGTFQMEVEELSAP
jgi:murein DD-endopeptidase MepM/ murein hydrolase activator NlpD